MCKNNIAVAYSDHVFKIDSFLYNFQNNFYEQMWIINRSSFFQNCPHDNREHILIMNPNGFFYDFIINIPVHMWVLKAISVLYAFPQTSHENGLKSEWVSKCLLRWLAFGEYFPHTSHLWQPPEDPRCIFLCFLKPESDENPFLHKWQNANIFCPWKSRQWVAYSPTLAIEMLHKEHTYVWISTFPVSGVSKSWK